MVVNVPLLKVTEAYYFCCCVSPSFRILHGTRELAEVELALAGKNAHYLVVDVILRMVERGIVN